MIETILKQNKIPFKKIDEGKCFKLFKLNSKLHLFYMYNESNTFLMERDFFDYLDLNSIPYVILCHNITKDELYFLKLNKNTNWIKSCFNTCDKDSIYLGKQVLNSKVDKNTLIKNLMYLCK